MSEKLSFSPDDRGLGWLGDGRVAGDRLDKLANAVVHVPPVVELMLGPDISDPTIDKLRDRGVEILGVSRRVYKGTDCRIGDTVFVAGDPGEIRSATGLNGEVRTHVPPEWADQRRQSVIYMSDAGLKLTRLESGNDLAGRQRHLRAA